MHSGKWPVGAPVHQVPFRAMESVPKHRWREESHMECEAGRSE